MGGVIGFVSKQDCVMDLFFGTDYHSHLGTKRSVMIQKTLMRYYSNVGY